MEEHFVATSNFIATSVDIAKSSYFEAEINNATSYIDYSISIVTSSVSSTSSLGSTIPNAFEVCHTCIAHA